MGISCFTRMAGTGIEGKNGATVGWTWSSTAGLVGIHPTTGTDWPRARAEWAWYGTDRAVVSTGGIVGAGGEGCVVRDPARALSRTLLRARS